eukprot:TRINITY_DN10372_c0_g1_i2.p1 TRINITY_DN10372_c0_g1~~TRINITY_DN10372_c0_g1_i2.p1  ORF type:complete len:365 (-),score=61.69 TRINITY_DN10372_c0_g1_i2:40-1134(-)
MSRQGEDTEEENNYSNEEVDDNNISNENLFVNDEGMNLQKQNSLQQISLAKQAINITSNSLYENLNEFKLAQWGLQQINAIQNQYGISGGKAIQILSEINWQPEKLQDYVDKNFDKLFDSQEIQQQDKNKQIVANQDICPICLSISLIQSNEAITLSCNHKFCKSCFQNYVKSQIDKYGQQIIYKNCPRDGCKVYLDSKMLESVFKDINDKYKTNYTFTKFLLQEIEQNCNQIIKCLLLNCNLYLMVKQKKINLKTSQYNVKCANNHNFCSFCKFDAHKPLKCQFLAKWKSLLQGENQDYLNSICLNEWVNHKDFYSCNKYKAVSYTHLTLPTICSVQISVVAVSLKKKKRQREQTPTYKQVQK